MKNEIVKIRGENDKIILFIDPHVPLETAMENLFSVVSEAFPLLSSNKIILNFGDRRNINPIFRNIIEKFEKLNLPLEKVVLEISSKKSFVETPLSFSKRESFTVLKRTIRSGQKVFNEGDVIVFGDVNPGGEVSATGSITILGDTRGVVHAGVKGDTNTYIILYNLKKSSQIRIGNYMMRGEEFLKKVKKEDLHGAKIIYIYKGEFAFTSDFSILKELREVENEG